MKIRLFKEDDLASLVTLFIDSVRTLAAPYYDEPQRTAWALAASANQKEWLSRLRELTVYVAELNDQLLGFIAFNNAGYIDLLYTAPAVARKGVASSLYLLAESLIQRTGFTQITTDASLAAVDFFQNHGFVIVAEEQVIRNGTMLARVKMKKSLSVKD